MGSTARLVVLGPDAAAHAAWAEARVASLEARWSRFRPTSEISRLNRAVRGRPVLVSPDTYRLVSTAVAASAETGGRFDPTLLDVLEAHGYDRTFAALTDVVDTAPLPPRPVDRTIRFDPALGAITLPAGVSFDPGGIGKGLAADIVAEALVARGATGALVDLGGDIRVIGDGPHDGAWVIEIEHPAAPGADEGPLRRLALRDGAVATSSTQRRAWNTPTGRCHHVLDPATGAPVQGRAVAATAIAATAWRAEAATKAALVAGRADVLAGVHVLLVDRDGGVVATTGPEVLVA